MRSLEASFASALRVTSSPKTTSKKSSSGRILRRRSIPPGQSSSRPSRNSFVALHVAIRLKKPFSDGTYAVDLDPLSLLTRLCASVPPPPFHTTRYAGVLARPHSRPARPRPSCFPQRRPLRRSRSTAAAKGSRRRSPRRIPPSVGPSSCATDAGSPSSASIAAASSLEMAASSTPSRHGSGSRAHALAPLRERQRRSHASSLRCMVDVVVAEHSD